MKTTKTVGVFVGRMQPLHFGHIEIIQRMLKMHDYALVVIGSFQAQHTERNPLSGQLRYEIIDSGRQSLPMDDRNRVILCGLPDLTSESDNSYEWGEYLEDAIWRQIRNFTTAEISNVTMHYSDSMKIISEWFDGNRTGIEFYIHNRRNIQNGVSATEIRKSLLELLPIYLDNPTLITFIGHDTMSKKLHVPVQVMGQCDQVLKALQQVEKKKNGSK